MDTLRINRNKLALSLISTGLAASALAACSDTEPDARPTTNRNVGCAVVFDQHDLQEYASGQSDLAEDLAADADMTVSEAEQELSRENYGADPDLLPGKDRRFVLIGQKACNLIKNNPERRLVSITQLFESN
ncbi:MAG TPA: hypothetical protein PK096_03645 [Candidatus Saccharibacteria bacterium]|nr:hypothetical protein [Candidatus Saccharibacteria bacterium]HRK94437.1 hypothetical protein [Candidatus Saccharibacteria bacterium]